MDKMLFIFSPILSLPFVLVGLYKKNKVSFILFCLFFALLSYGYYPGATNDKSYYIYLYKNFDYLGYYDFINSFLSEKSDFILYLILFVFAKSGLSFELFSLLVTFMTVYFILKPFFDKNIGINSIYAFLAIILPCFWMSYPDLFSGLRNYLSISFLFYSIYLYIEKKRKIFSCFFLFLSVLTHFSSVFFILGFMVFFVINIKYIKFLFLLSIPLIFFNKNFIYDFLSQLNLVGIYEAKANAYLAEDSFMENSLSAGNFNNLLRIFFNTSWFYLAYVVIFFNFKNNSNIFKLLFSMMIFINIIYSALDLLIRYSFLMNLILIYVVFYVKELKYRNFTIAIILFFSICSFGFNLAAIKDPIMSSYIKYDYLTLPNIFFIDTTSSTGRY